MIWRALGIRALFGTNVDNFVAANAPKSKKLQQGSTNRRKGLNQNELETTKFRRVQ